MPSLIVFCHLRWNFVYQRPQHLLSRLAKHYDVVFVEEPLLTAGPPSLEIAEVAPGVTVLRPHTSLPVGGFNDDQLEMLGPLVCGYLRQNAIDDYVVWFYTPMALPVLSSLDPRAVVFDCMDELSCFKGAPAQLRHREAALIKSSHLVLTGGPSLYEAKRSLHPNTVCLPSAVDAMHYAPGSPACTAGVLAAAQLQADIPSPRLGFFGVIDERLDIELVEAVADADPQWHVVMVGPVVKVDPAQLPRRHNIHWLGQQPYSVLPALVAGWDVCLLPFALNEATRFISPTKTLEYLAADKPVVSTPIHDVVQLYGHAIEVAGSAAVFVDACRRVLSESNESRTLRAAQARDTVARYSWDRAADRVLAEMRSVLSPRPTQRRPQAEVALAARPYRFEPRESRAAALQSAAGGAQGSLAG